MSLGGKDEEQETKLSAELQWWKGWFASWKTPEAFLEHRKVCYDNLIRHLPHVSHEAGSGLDLGCGLVSIYEFADDKKKMVAIDPLLKWYDEIYKKPSSKVIYDCTYNDDGVIPYIDNFFMFVSCINVIDHTAFHKELIAEIKRVLIPGGMLYLQVNFDPELKSPHHVKQWNHSVIDEELSGFKRLYEIVEWNDIHGKDFYWGRFRNEK